MENKCQEICTTFGSYIQNFNSLQPTSIVDFFHLPAMLMTSAQVAAMQNPIEVLGTFAILMDSLKAKKFDRSEIVGELKVTQLSDNQGMVEGVAKRFNQANEEIEHFGFTYTLRKIETEWKIIVGVIHEPKSYILSI